MSRPIDPKTQRVLNLRVGQSCVIDVRSLSRKSLQKYAPQGRWTAESREGGLVVTRVR